MDLPPDIITQIFQQSGWRAATCLGLSNKNMYSIYLSNRRQLLQTCLLKSWMITKLPHWVMDRACDGRLQFGIVVPCYISLALSKFLGVPAPTKVTRPEVITQIENYIQVHRLQKPGDRLEINPDDKLLELLPDFNLAVDTLTFWNLQKYVKPNFLNTMPTVASKISPKMPLSYNQQTFMQCTDEFIKMWSNSCQLEIMRNCLLGI